MLNPPQLHVCALPPLGELPRSAREAPSRGAHCLASAPPLPGSAFEKASARSARPLLVLADTSPPKRLKMDVEESVEAQTEAEVSPESKTGISPDQRVLV